MDSTGARPVRMCAAHAPRRHPCVSHHAAIGKPTTHEEGIMSNRKLSFVGASLAVAIGMFAARMLISPPVTMAATNQGINVAQMALDAPRDLPSFDATYQRHTGVLDTLK